jgi:hypothetical protein
MVGQSAIRILLLIFALNEVIPIISGLESALGKHEKSLSERVLARRTKVRDNRLRLLMDDDDDYQTDSQMVLLDGDDDYDQELQQFDGDDDYQAVEQSQTETRKSSENLLNADSQEAESEEFAQQQVEQDSEFVEKQKIFQDQDLDQVLDGDDDYEEAQEDSENLETENEQTLADGDDDYVEAEKVRVVVPEVRASSSLITRAVQSNQKPSSSETKC